MPDNVKDVFIRRYSHGPFIAYDFSNDIEYRYIDKEICEIYN